MGTIEAIEEARDALNVTREALCREAQISSSVYSRAINDKRRLSNKVAEKLVAALERLKTDRAALIDRAKQVASDVECAA